MNGNDENAYTQKLRNFLDPENLNLSLRFVAVFIAVYENYKSTIVENVKSFYLSGIKNGKSVYKRYDEEVLSKVSSGESRTLRATIKWLSRNGAIDDSDEACFRRVTDARNELTHNMTSLLFEGVDEKYIQDYCDMIALFGKIDKWWISEIEIPTDPDMTQEKYNSIDWNGVTSVNLIFLKIMSDIALTGNDKYLQMVKQSTDSKDTSSEEDTQP